MGNDVMQHRVAIGIFNNVRNALRCKYHCLNTSWLLCKFLSISLPADLNVLACILVTNFKTCFVLLTLCYLQIELCSGNVVITLLLLLLLAGDIESNPGPSDDVSFSPTCALSILHLNTRSVRHKLSFLKEYLSDYAIVCFTETHLDNNISDRDLIWEGFHNPLRKDRTAFGGGLLIYISKCLSFKRRFDLESEFYETIWVQLYLPQKSLILCSAYRPETISREFWNYLDNSIENAFDLSSCVMIVGDLNTNLLNGNSNNLTDIMISKHLRNVITDPTRVTKTTRTLLDPMILSDDVASIHSGTVDFDNTISDHKGTYAYLDFQLSMNKSYKRVVWCYKHGDYAKLNKLINDTNWSEMFEKCNDIDVAVDNFYTTLTKYITECIPTKQVTIRPNDKPWFNSILRKEFRKRDRLRKLAKKYNHEKYTIAYKRQRNKVNNMKYYAKELFYSNLDGYLFELHTLNRPSYWKLLRFLVRNSGAHTCLPALRKTMEQQAIFCTDLEKAEALNDYFVENSILPETASKIPELKLRSRSSITNLLVTDKDISDIIKSLPTKKSCGPDKISHNLMKHICDSLSKPLGILFNLSLSQCKYPTKWKLAHVIPLFKKGDSSLISNYRPISLISCVGKVFEKAVLKYLSNYLLDNNLLYKYQSGFQIGHSTVHQLVELYDNICTALDKKEDYCMVFCDISKAFDRVWHKGLLLKLKSYGIRGQVLHWLDSYISGRKQKTFINGKLSCSKSLNAGVPQGSVLGPFLFIIYINDIADNLQCVTRLFADDTSLGYASTDRLLLQSTLNENLEHILNWANQWLITFNPTKTESVYFSLKRHDRNIRLLYDGEIIENVNNHKHLGVTFSYDGKWSHHIENVVKNVSKMIYSMRKLKYLVNRNTLNSIYMIYIRPHFEYACEVWDGCTIDQSETLERLQLEAARIVTGLPTYTRREYLYLETGWQTLSERRTVRKLCLIYKISNNIAPLYLANKLPANVGTNLNYNLRNSHDITQPYTRTSLYAN